MGTVGMIMMGMILSKAILTSLEELAPQDDSKGSGPRQVGVNPAE